MIEITLAPSDFSFLWRECPRCWWLKVVAGLKMDTGPFPSIFQTIDRGMKLGFEDRDLRSLGVPGRVLNGERQVISKWIEYPDLGVRLRIKGKYDSLAVLDDGSYAIIDYKATVPKAWTHEVYARAMHAYRLAIENPHDHVKQPPLSVTRLTLICWAPAGAMCIGDEGVPSALLGDVTSIEVPISDAKFDDFLRAVANRAAGGPPEPNSDCGRCSFMSSVAGYMRTLKSAS